MPAPHAGDRPLPSHDPRSDHDLIDAINAGDVRAFDTLYERHKQWTANLAHRFTRDRELALDVLQETFLYVLGKFPGFELRCRFRTFLYPVVRNLSVTLQSRGRRERSDHSRDVADESVASSAVADPPAELLSLHEAVDDLPAGQREVVFLRFADDLPLAEIALALGVPEGTVKSRLHHALKTLREDPRARRLFEDR